MDRLIKLVPWLLSAVLAVLLALNWQQSRATLEQKDAEVQGLKQQIEKVVSEANKKIEMASQREVEVRVSFRKAFLSSGNVAGITNLSNQTIAIAADIGRPASGQTRSFEITIDPGRTKEVGELEGWAFVPGDTLKVSQTNHKALIFTAP